MASPSALRASLGARASICSGVVTNARENVTCFAFFRSRMTSTPSSAASWLSKLLGESRTTICLWSLRFSFANTVACTHLELSAPFHKYDNVLFGACSPLGLCCCREGINLPRKSPYRIVLTKQEREELERRANKYTLPYFMVALAKMILLTQQGLSNDQIADRLSTRREIVSRWRKRFFKKRLAGLEDSERPGRPRVFPPRAGRAG